MNHPLSIGRGSLLECKKRLFGRYTKLRGLEEYKRNINKCFPDYARRKKTLEALTRGEH